MSRMVFMLGMVIISFASFSQIDSSQMIIDSLEAQLQYKVGEIKFESGIGTLSVPSGFRFLDAEQSQYVISDLWGNPKDESILGMIVPDTKGVLGMDSWAFIITFEDMGYVKDDDADDINYDDLLKDIQEDATAANDERVKAGYESIEIVGWASKPFYDADKKVLHWAKEIKFGESEFNTLNYNVRVLGRKGVLVLNAVASMSELGEVQKSIDPVLSSFEYADGEKYNDFNPELDEVAAWTIGGLVAGKVLAKVGIFAILLKYIKIIAIAVGGAATGLWKWYKRKTQLPEVRNIEDTNTNA